MDLNSVDGNVTDAYARALLHAAQAEGNSDRLEDNLFRFARLLDDNAELRDRLTDPSLDLSTKLSVVDELLGGYPETASAVMWLLQSGRIRQLPDVASRLSQLAAEARGQAAAEVRTAVPLDSEQERRLGENLAKAAGRPVQLKVIVDPDVLGGIVVKLGDTIIDGSVARRLSELRAALTGA